MHYMHDQNALKGNLYSEIAKVSTLLLLGAVALGVTEKRNNMLDSQFTFKMETNIVK